MFDPYRKWLGIPEDQRPATHYQLLGISPDEQDIDVIEAAVLRQSAFVRNFQSGQHADDATRILNEIAAARLCLVDRQKRAKYDAELRKKQSIKPAAGRPRDSNSALGDSNSTLRDSNVGMGMTPPPAAEVVSRPAPAFDLDQLVMPAPRRPSAAGRRLPAGGRPAPGRRTSSQASIGYVWQVPLLAVIIIILTLLARLIGHSIAEQRALRSQPPQVEQSASHEGERE